MRRPAENALGNSGAGPHLQGSGREAPPAPEATDPVPVSLGPEWACDVTGLVVGLPQTAPMGAGQDRVLVAAEVPDPVVHLPVSADGRFGGHVSLPARSTLLSFIVRSGTGKAVSPLVVREVTDGDRVGVVLFVTAGAILRARVVDESGSPVPRAQVMVLKRPVKPDQGPPNYAVETILPVAYITTTDGEDSQPLSPTRSDQEGLFELPPMALAAFPLRAAVGSSAHEVLEVTFDGNARDVILQRQPRPSLQIRLSGGGLDPQVSADALIDSAVWTMVSRQRHSLSAVPVGAGAGPFPWVRDALLRGAFPERYQSHATAR